MIELYIYVAVISALFYGLGMSIDKLFFTQSPITYSREAVSIAATWVYGTIGILLVFFTPVNLTPEPIQLLGLVSSGVFFGAGIFMYFHAMRKESASKVGQLASLEAVTTPIFAIFLLKETPSTEAILAITLILIGLFLLVFDRGTAKAIATTKIAVIPILIAVLFWSSQDTITKYVSETQNVWTLYFWIRTGSAVTMSALLLKKKNRQDFTKLIQNIKEHNSYYLIISNTITAGGLFAALAAIKLGPLTIVAPILAAYSIFALIFSILFTKLTTYDVHGTERKYVFKRVISILLFISGITLLTIT